MGEPREENNAPVKYRGHHKTERCCIKLQTGQAVRKAVKVEGGNWEACPVWASVRVVVPVCRAFYQFLSSKPCSNLGLAWQG